MFTPLSSFRFYFLHNQSPPVAVPWVLTFDDFYRSRWHESRTRDAAYFIAPKNAVSCRKTLMNNLNAPDTRQFFLQPLQRQIKAVMHVKEKRQITNKEYQEICKTSKRTASRDLLDLASSGVFEQIGTTGVGTAYILKAPYGATMTPQ